MPEAVSRAVFAAEMVAGLPVALLVATTTLPGAVLLTPMAVFGLGRTAAAGGPGMWRDLGTGAGVLLMALLSACAVAALAAFLGLAGRFLVLGGAGLRGQAGVARFAVLAAAPPLLLSSVPRLLGEASAGPLALDRLMAAGVYGGLPLLVPAGHLLLELRRGVRPPPLPAP